MDKPNSGGSGKKKAAAKPKDDLDSNNNCIDKKVAALKDDRKYSNEESEQFEDETTYENDEAAANKNDRCEENDHRASDNWAKKRSASARNLSETVGAIAVPGIDALNEPEEVTQETQTETTPDSAIGGNETSCELTDGPEIVPVDFPDDRPDVILNHAEKEKTNDGDVCGGYVPAVIPAKERPSLVDTTIVEPPLDPELLGINGTVDEPPFNEGPRIEDQTEAIDDHGGTDAGYSLPVISARLAEDPPARDESQQDEDENSYCIVVDAKPIKREHICRTILRSRATLCVIVLILLVVVGLGIGLGLTLGTSKTTETASPTSSPTAIPLSIDEVRNVILDTFPSAATSLEGELSSSPRRRALQWVFEDQTFTAYDEERIVQRWILATYYYAMSGDSWAINEGWLTHDNELPDVKNECRWYGLSCNQTDDLSIGMTSLSMEGNFVSGTLPSEIAWFNESLQFIQLKNNSIIGSIPTEYGQLTKLKRMTTRINKMRGPIPTELGLLEHLEVLRVDQNKHTGAIPSELGLLKNLTLLNVRGNKLCGDMPQEICERSDNFTLLQADCEGPEINCSLSCCTKCWQAKRLNCSIESN